MDRIASAYEQVPYPGFADAETHLRNLETLATLLGMRPANVHACRVLELGCAAGHNLIPQAAEYPGSRFVGVDLAAPQIAGGQHLIRDVGLDNVELRQGSILDVDASWGPFDYILCSGVFSWVSPEIQDKILSICREHLAPHGVGVISYNAYPGWHFRTVARDLLRYHVAGVDQPQQQLEQARAMLEFVANHAPQDTLPGMVFRAERDYLRQAREEYLYHDYLVEDNRPLYFHEFVARASHHGLQFACDASLAKMHGTFLPAAVQEVLAHTPLVQQCQLLDFLRNEAYHKTLLCHRETQLQRPWSETTMQLCSVTLPDPPQPREFDVGSCEPLGLEFPLGRLTTSSPLGKAALRCLLAARPQALSLTDLHAAALEALPAQVRQPANAGPPGLRDLGRAMLGACCAGIVRCYLHPPRFCSSVNSRPSAAPWTRWWAARQTQLVNQKHENVLLNEVQNYLLSQLDGQHDRLALSDRLGRAVAAGGLTIDAPHESVLAATDAALAEICDKALLVG